MTKEERIEHAQKLVNEAIKLHDNANTEDDKTKAVEKIKEAADLGHPIAQYNLAMSYFDGFGVEQSDEMGFKLLQIAAENKEFPCAEAMYVIGRSYYRGERVVQDYKKAYYWLEKAIAQNFPDAYNLMGIMFREGCGVEKDAYKAMEYWQEAIRLGNIDAIVNVASLYESGEGGMPKNYDKVFELMKIAADSGVAEAQYYIGFCYHRGQRIPVDYDKAIKYINLAIEQGHVKAMEEMLVCYCLGHGVEHDMNKLYQLAVKAAQLGSEFANELLKIT